MEFNKLIANFEVYSNIYERNYTRNPFPLGLIIAKLQNVVSFLTNFLLLDYISQIL